MRSRKVKGGDFRDNVTLPFIDSAELGKTLTKEDVKRYIIDDAAKDMKGLTEKEYKERVRRFNLGSKVFTDYINRRGLTGDIIASFDDWMGRRLIAQIISQAIPVGENGTKTIRFSGVKYYKKRITRKIIEDGVTVEKQVDLLPALARSLSTTYGIAIYCDMGIYDEDGVPIKMHENPVYLGTYPVMVGSKFGHLAGCSDKERLEKGECHRDPKGYMIIKGAEKAILLKENLRENRILIYEVKDGVICRMTCVTSTMRTATVQLSITKNHKKGILGAIFVRLMYTQSKAVITCYQALRGLYKVMTENNRSLSDENFENFDFYTNAVLRFVPDSEKDAVKFQLIPTITATKNVSDDPSFVHRFTGHRPDEFAKRSNELSRKYYDELVAEMFPQIKVLDEFQEIDPERVSDKFDMLCVMIAKYARYLSGFISMDDRDNWGNKMLKLPGYTMERWWAKSWENSVMSSVSNAVKNSSSKDATILRNAVRAVNYNNTMHSYLANFSGSSWTTSSKGYNMDSTAVDVGRNSLLESYSIIMKINAPTNHDAAQLEIRKVQASQCGYVCAAETPEGKRCGLIKNKASGCWISIYREEKPIKASLSKIIGTKANDKLTHLCILNGTPLGWGNPRKVMRVLENLRRNTADYFDISFIVDGLTVVISSDAGRPTRPLFVVKNWTENGTRHSKLWMDIPDEDGSSMWGKSFDYLIRTGRVRYVDAMEQENSAVAPTILMFDDVQKELADAYVKLVREQEFAKKASNTYVREPAEIKIGGRIIQGEREVLVTKKYVSTRLQDAKDTFDRLNRKNPYDYCELDPNSIGSVSVGMIPFANHNPGPRITYQAAMGKQAKGDATSVDHLRFDALSKSLAYPSAPLTKTNMHDRIGMEDLPTGQTVILAFLAYTGNNQEDAIIMNKASIDRGLFRYLVHKSKKVVIKYGGGDGSREEFSKPTPREGYPAGAYNHIKEDGMPMIGSRIGTNYVIIGRTRTIHIDGEDDQIYDTSVYASRGDEGYIEEVIAPTTIPGTSNNVAKVKIRKYRQPIVGDKLASRHAQKSVIGTILPEEDMPFTESGLKPDIIINPHAIPSRMTIGKLIEVIASKTMVMTGEEIDATAFKPFDIDELTRSLTSIGFTDMGGMADLSADSTEVMINGMTGEPLHARVMIGPCYYQSLAHDVMDKTQIRATGQVHRQTRQPVAGAVRGGGLRLGEMALTALAAHGAAQVINERTCTSADEHVEIYCTVCNKQSIQRIETRELGSGKTEYKTVYGCKTCDEPSFGRCTISNSVKFVQQTLIGAGVVLDIELDDLDDDYSYEF